MINQISTKTRFGWISAFENRGKIFKVKFGRSLKQKFYYYFRCKENIDDKDCPFFLN